MLDNKLLTMIEKNSAHMAAVWAKTMRDSEYAKSYHKLPDDELTHRCQDVFDHLRNWIESDFSMMQIGKVYATVGKQRYLEGVPLCQVQYALHLTKKVLWNYLFSEGILNSALEIYQAIDLIVRVTNFFDIASFYIIRGYMEEIYIQLGQSHCTEMDKLQASFPEGSFLFRFKPEEWQAPSKS
jgi:hypothetical protein